MPNNKGAANNGGTGGQASRKPAGKQTSKWTTRYLIVYNMISNILWATLTQRLVVSLVGVLGDRLTDGAASSSVSGIFDELYPSLALTQSLAVLEVVHALFGLVRASVVTTTMQVASRVIVVWGVMYMFSVQEMGGDGILGGGQVAAAAAGPKQGQPGDWAFVGCLVAWGITECVRYGFFVLQLSGKGVPKWLLWLRYNTFFVLYPLGISCECSLWYLAREPAVLIHPGLPWLFLTLLGLYVPGSYVLYTHMMAQRRKVMRAQKKAD